MYAIRSYYERQQGAADQGNVRCSEIGRHLAHAVAEPDACFRGGELAFAAPAAGELALFDHRRDFVEALRMAGHQQKQQAGDFEPSYNFV